MEKIKKISIYLLCTLVIIIFCTFGYVFINKVNDKSEDTINIVMEIYNNTDADQGLIQEIESKIMKEKNKTTNDDFILGYINQMKGNYYIANAYFKLVIDNIDNNTNTIAKIYSYKFIAQDMMNKGQEKEAINCLQESFDSISIAEYNKYHKEIKDMLTPIFIIDDGREAISKIYEKVLTESKIDKDAEWYTYRMMASLYHASGELIKAIEAHLKIIDSSDKFEDGDYYKAKSSVDLALIYIYFGEYNLAKDLLETLDEIKIRNEEFEAAIKCYSLINLSEVDIILEDYDEAIKRINEIDQYQEFFTEDNWNDYKILKCLIISEPYIYKGLYEEAERLLEEAYNLMQIDKTEMYTDKDIRYHAVYGILMESLNYYEEALESYEEALDLCILRNNKEYKEMVLNHLIEYYENIGDNYNQLKYIEQKSEFIKERNSEINKSIIFHISEKFEYEKLILNNIKNRYIYIFIMILVAVIFIITTLFIFKLYHRNKYDGLTNICNRGYLNKQYKKLINGNKEFYIIMFDIDNFKNLNDTYGHNFGDTVLINITKVIKNFLNSSRGFFRYGGEEFIIILKNKPREQIIDLAEQIRIRVGKIKWDEDVRITISIGVASYDGQNKNVLKEADDNLYTSKTTGKNKVTIT